MNEPSHSSPPALQRCSPVLSTARHGGADGEIAGCELCLSLPIWEGATVITPHSLGCYPETRGPSREESPGTSPASPWLSVLETLGEVTPPPHPQDSGRIHQAGRQDERTGDFPVQKLEASPANPETGALSSQSRHAPRHPVSTHIQHQGELHHTGWSCAGIWEALTRREPIVQGNIKVDGGQASHAGFCLDL